MYGTTLRSATGWLLNDEGVAAVVETCPSILTHDGDDVAAAAEMMWTDAGGAGGTPWVEAFGTRETAAKWREGAVGGIESRCRVQLSVMDAFEEEEEEDDGERKASLMRHVVDFSGRVLEPALRRVDVRKEKEANGPPSKTPSTRGVVYE